VFIVAAAGWSLIMTITGVFTFCDSAVASCAVSGVWDRGLTPWICAAAVAAVAGVACVMANVAVAVAATANASFLLRRMEPSGRRPVFRPHSESWNPKRGDASRASDIVDSVERRFSQASYQPVTT
jgi:hypothetical protein